MTQGHDTYNKTWNSWHRATIRQLSIFRCHIQMLSEQLIQWTMHWNSTVLYCTSTVPTLYPRWASVWKNMWGCLIFVELQRDQWCKTAWNQICSYGVWFQMPKWTWSVNIAVKWSRKWIKPPALLFMSSCVTHCVGRRLSWSYREFKSCLRPKPIPQVNYETGF